MPAGNMSLTSIFIKIFVIHVILLICRIFVNKVDIENKRITSTGLIFLNFIQKVQQQKIYPSTKRSIKWNTTHLDLFMSKEFWRTLTSFHWMRWKTRRPRNKLSKTFINLSLCGIRSSEFCQPSATNLNILTRWEGNSNAGKHASFLLIMKSMKIVKNSITFYFMEKKANFCS